MRAEQRGECQLREEGQLSRNMEEERTKKRRVDDDNKKAIHEQDTRRERMTEATGLEH